MPRKRRSVLRWRVSSITHAFPDMVDLTCLTDDGDGTRSGTPTSIAAAESETADEPQAQDTQDRHRELMNRIFPHGMEGPRVAEQFFPRHEQADTPSAGLKTESERDDSREASSVGGGVGQPPPVPPTTDVVMQDTSEAQAEGEGRREEQQVPNVQDEEDAKMEHAAADADSREQEAGSRMDEGSNTAAAAAVVESAAEQQQQPAAAAAA